MAAIPNGAAKPNTNPKLTILYTALTVNTAYTLTLTLALTFGMAALPNGGPTPFLVM